MKTSFINIFFKQKQGVAMLQELNFFLCIFFSQSKLKGLVFTFTLMNRYLVTHCLSYRSALKSLARRGRKQTTATEAFDLKLF